MRGPLARSSTLAVALFSAGVALACAEGSGTTASGSALGSASGAAPTAPPSDPAKLLDLRRAEQRRTARGVTADAQNDRDPVVRRRAARALARIASPAARPGLLRALSDADDETVAWAAYGLGATCGDDPEGTVSALAARSLTVPEVSAARLDPLVQIARAIGRCAAKTTEATLTAWLASSPARARAAALGMGDFVMIGQRLEDGTLATLLNLAIGSPSTPALAEALYPIGRLEKPPKSVLGRIVEVGAKVLETPSDLRILAIRALGRSRSEGAAPLLEKAVGATDFTAEERVEAARALGRAGAAGLAAVAKAIAANTLGADGIATGGAPYEVLLTLLLVEFEPGEAKSRLGELAKIGAPAGASASAKRRVSAIRCAAAVRLAGANVADPTLLACDLDAGSVGSRAVVKVLDHGPIEGARRATWATLARSKDPRTREAAIGLIPSHAELVDTWEILAEALEAAESGVVEAATEVLTAFPDEGAPAPKTPKKKKEKEKGKDAERPKPKAGVPPLEPHKRIVDALAKALERAEQTADIELELGVVDALGALQRRSFEPKLVEICGSTYPSLREHAATALGMISGAKHACPAPDAPGPDPAEIGASEAPIKVVLETDAGTLRLELDAQLAPVAVARFSELVKAGFYDGNLLHRVDPAFVVQWGSPWADGSGGPPGKAPLRCETTPLPFDRYAIGVALSGRDTGSSQFFVTRSRAPHLDGQYALIGRASGPWDAVSEGDVIQKARVE